MSLLIIYPLLDANTWELEKVAIAKHCDLKAAQLCGSRQSFWAVIGHFVLRMRSNCYFAASDKNSDIAIRFSDPDFLKESNDLAIRQRFHAVTLTFDIWSWTFVVHRVSRYQTLYEIWPKSNNPRLSYWSFSTFSHIFHSCKNYGRGKWNVWVVLIHVQPRIPSLIYF